MFKFTFLPLDEAVASRAVLVIVSGSDDRANGRKRFRSQLINSKTVRDRKFVSLGSYCEPIGGLSNGPIPDLSRPRNPQTGGRKVPFKNSANQMEVVENVNRTHIRIGLHWLIVE